MLAEQPGQTRAPEARHFEVEPIERHESPERRQDCYRSEQLRGDISRTPTLAAPSTVQWSAAVDGGLSLCWVILGQPWNCKQGKPEFQPALLDDAA
jgi:hypothetical protein